MAAGGEREQHTFQYSGVRGIDQVPLPQEIQVKSGDNQSVGRVVGSNPDGRVKF